MRLLHSAVPLVAMLAVLPLHIGVMCEGWQATAEARLGCCASGGDCGMHEIAVSDTSAATTQLEADQCCAASESDDSRAAESGFVLTMPPMHLRLVRQPEPRPQPFGDSPSAIPPAAAHVPRHLLLSVFLV